MHSFTRAASLAAMFLFVFACSESSSTSTTGASGSMGSTSSGGDPAAIVDMFCNTLARPFCEADAACLLAPYIAGRGRDVDECVELVLSGYPRFCSPDVDDTRALLIASLHAGTTVFDQAQFDTCLARLKAMAAGGAVCTEPPHEVFGTTCWSAFQGQGAPGDACPFPVPGLDGPGETATLSCKDGRCEDRKCVPFLKTGDACALIIGGSDASPGDPTAMLCNFPKREVCWGDPGAGGAGGGGGAGGAAPMGICRPKVEIGDACHPNNSIDECTSCRCDATGKCVLTEPGSWSCF